MEDRAKFIGYQECPGHAPLALYNVLDRQHRLYGSTVSAATLAREKILVPETPKYYDADQLAMGIKVEAEHTSAPAVAEKIAKDHLDELPDYYTRLAKMESEAGLKTKTNPEDKNCLAAWETQLMQGVPNIGQFTPEQIKELKRRVKSGELGTFKAPWAGQYGTTKTFYQKQSKTNPANKSYKGDTDVKAIGNIPAPRPGMMMVVNPGKMRDLSKKQMAARKLVINRLDKGLQSGVLWLRPNFGDRVITPDGKIGILRGSGGLGSQRVKVMFSNGGYSFENWDDLRPAKVEKKNPALLILNPRTAVKAYSGKGGYTVIIGRSVYEMSHNATSPQGVNQYVGELKDLPGTKQGRLVAVKSLPVAVQQAITARLQSLRSYLPKTGPENPAKPVKKSTGEKLITANVKIIDRGNGEIGSFKGPQNIYQTSPTTGTMAITGHKVIKKSGEWVLDVTKAKANPMVKDMTSRAQKQDIKSELQRMAKIQPRVHPEFLNLKAAAEYVEKNIAPVGKIVHGKNAYIIRHAKGIAAFSTTKNNKLIML